MGGLWCLQQRKANEMPQGISNWRQNLLLIPTIPQSNASELPAPLESKQESTVKSQLGL